jgi:hypothetical protein
VENLALLRDPHSGVNIALVQGGGVGKAAGETQAQLRLNAALSPGDRFTIDDADIIATAAD